MGTTPPDEAGDEAAGGPSAAKPAPSALLVSLVPNSTIQFLDFTMSEEAVAHVRRRFFEDRGGPDGQEPSLHAASMADGVFYHPVTQQPCDPAYTYALGGVEALSPFLGTWLPLPYMRVSKDPRTSELVLDEGPSNWTRVLIARAQGAAGESGYRVVLAVDTAVEPEGEAPVRAYAAPSAEDVRSGAAYRFSDDVDDVAWFATEAWVDDWLSTTFAAGRRESASAQSTASAPGALEHLAHYLTLLAVLKEACELPALRFMEPAVVGPYAETVPADLALDIGSSRTCALIEEHLPQGPAGRAGARRVEPLALRDLAEPWRTSPGTFPSRLEFSRAQLGNDALSRWSGRTDAFQWPSLARVGAEAARLAAEPAVPDAVTGVSSPMHYVWDERPSRHVWRFAGAAAEGSRRNPIVSGLLLAHLTEAGDVLEARQGHGATTKPRFSRSALTTLYVAEVLLHAVSTINSARHRAASPRPEAARRLERVLVTVPAGMPDAEIGILRRRIEGAVRLVWSSMGWTGGAAGGDASLHPPPPTVRLVADTATSTQVAYLENEISHKFRGKAEVYFGLVGKPRAGFASPRTLRIATLDVGAAATGLSVATYELAQGGVLAITRQLVDGFETGAEDVIRAYAERLILPAMERRLGDCKLGDPRRFLEAVTCADERTRPAWVGDMGRRLAAEILLPAGSALLQLHVHSEPEAGDAPSEPTLGALLASQRARAGAAAERLDVLAADEGADGFSPLEVTVPFLARELGAIARDVLRPMLRGAVRVIESLDCDLVLVSGRGARLPAVIEALLEGMPLRPDRIVPLHEHRMAAWYGFSDSAGRVGDPKPLAAVGALLQGRGMLGADGLELVVRPLDRAAARGFIGVLGESGRIAAADVLFDAAGPGRADRESGATRTVPVEPPALIGQRRTALETWPAQALYAVEIEGGGVSGRGPRLPLKVSLELVAGDRARPGTVRLVSAHDADGNRLEPGEIALRLKTRRFRHGYWLDTGHLSIGARGS